MPAKVIREINAKEYDAPRLAKRNGLWEGHRKFLVDSRHQVLALTATGLPADKSSYDPAIPECIALDFDFEALGGQDDAGGTGAVSIITVGFRTPSATVLPYAPGLKYTDTDIGTETVQQIYGLRYDTPGDPANGKAINNGDGVAREFGVINATIYVYYALDAYPINEELRWMKLARLRNLNDKDLIIPPKLGMLQGTGLKLAKGQLKYVGYKTRRVVNLVEVAHQVALAEDWGVRWYLQDDKGKRSGPEIRDDIYPEADLSGIW